MKPFTEECRYDYPLNKDSVVMDVGGYEGDFAHEIYQRYGCKITIFEPNHEKFEVCQRRFGNTSRVVVLNKGLGGSERGDVMRWKGSMTGLFSDGEPMAVFILDIARELSHPLHNGFVDLLKLNCEGSEFEILERILECGIAKQFKNIQVQFHPVVPDCERRYAAIREGLLKTHDQTFYEPWTWEGFELKP